MIIEFTDTNLRGHAFAHDEFKNSVAHDGYVVIVLKGALGTSYRVSPDEWQRIKPLLTGKAVTAPNKALLDAARDLSLFADELKVRQQHVTGYRDALPYSYYQVTKSYDLGVDGLMFQARKVAEMIHAVPSATIESTVLPADVIEAHGEIVTALNSLTDTKSKIDGEALIRKYLTLFEVVSKHIPAEGDAS